MIFTKKQYQQINQKKIILFDLDLQKLKRKNYKKVLKILLIDNNCKLKMKIDKFKIN